MPALFKSIPLHAFNICLVVFVKAALVGSFREQVCLALTWLGTIYPVR
jgi:hypothetical protein